MGCRDTESNFQTMVFNVSDGKWWAKWGVEASWLGPVVELVKKFPDLEEPRFEQNGFVYSAERMEDDDTMLVKRLGRISTMDL
jgi:hypothetical protein